MSQTIAELVALAAQTTDQSIVTTGGDYEYEVPNAGLTVGRFIEYIELGRQAQKPYQGKPKPDADVVRIALELLAPQNIREIDISGEKKLVSDVIYVKLTLKLGEKAKFRKFFKAMAYGRPIIHMAQMLGDAFKITVVHNPDEKNPKVIYANVTTDDGTVLIGAPKTEPDPFTGVVQDYAVPASLRPIRLFLFDNPSKETWDTLFIDGTREVKAADGTVTHESKNWLQETILSAKNYPGSRLEALLGGLDTLSIGATYVAPENAVPVAEVVAPVAAQPAPVAAAVVAPVAAQPAPVAAAPAPVAAAALLAPVPAPLAVAASPTVAAAQPLATAPAPVALATVSPSEVAPVAPVAAAPAVQTPTTVNTVAADLAALGLGVAA